eukprot:5443880-Amphidinium_carterae.1
MAEQIRWLQGQVQCHILDSTLGSCCERKGRYVDAFVMQQFGGASPYVVLTVHNFNNPRRRIRELDTIMIECSM